jgi:hypothetical protein
VVKFAGIGGPISAGASTQCPVSRCVGACPNPSSGGLPAALHATLDAILGKAMPFDAVVFAEIRPPSANAQNEFFARLRPPCAEAAGALVRLRRAPDGIVDENMPGRRRLLRREVIAFHQLCKAIGPQGSLLSPLRQVLRHRNGTGGSS